ncbi:MAG TPA: (d)CMP kinase [Acidimicrobiales bacterium]|nr:(d)CMP kinase [Acidimicrobiales bacterium]
MPVIAIDGPAGAGKSTVARVVASKLGLQYLDTGAMYRSVALAALRAGCDPSDAERVAAVAVSAAIELRPAEVVVLDGDDVTDAIRTEEVSRAVSSVAANPDVRKEMVRRQRQWLDANGGGVLEGRDIGTVVVPEAEVKVFLVADLSERARRHGLAHGEGVAGDIVRRDTADAGRKVSPMKRADDAVEIDTTHMTIDDVVAAIIELVER